jgi:ATP-binding cassette subfamily B protein
MRFPKNKPSPEAGIYEMSFRVLRRFVGTYVPEHALTYSLGLLLLAATVWVSIRVPKVIGHLVDQLQQVGITFAALQPTVLQLMALAVLLILFRTASRVVLFYPGRRVEQRIRQDFFEALVHLPQRIYNAYRVGDLMSRGINDVASVRVMLSMGILHSVNTVMLGVGAIQGMASLSVKLTLWVLLPLLAMIAVTGLAVRYIFRFVHESQAALGALTESTREALGAYALFNTYPIRGVLLERFQQVNARYSRTVQYVALLRTGIFPLMTTFIGCGVLLVLWIGGGMVMRGELALGALVAFMTYVWILADPAIAIGWVMNALQRGYSALLRLFEVMDHAGLSRRGGAMPVPEPERAPCLPAVVGCLTQVQVRGLRFTYPQVQAAESDLQADAGPERTFILQVDELALEPGKRLGIFGATGAGKSTLAALLAGAILPPRGCIRFNAVDACDLTPEQWRTWVSFVPQHTNLFSTSIQENICLAKPVDTCRLSEALEHASLMSDISGFPEGLQTRVGEGGVSLSGGQRQRISLARALYHGGQLLILDDMTSAIDLLTEAAVLKRIYSLRRLPMIVMISHRVNTLKECDEIIILDHGRISARGTHAALLQDNPLYRGTCEYEQALLQQQQPSPEEGYYAH